MNLLDSPLQHLPFHYLISTFLTPLNYLWTWLALSFWWKPKPQLPPSIVSDQVSPSDAVPEPFVPPTAKAKFTDYYIGEDVNIDSEWESDERRCRREKYCEERSDQWWEKLLRMRMGENQNGWYIHQDLSELNGNVVRLWDTGELFGTKHRPPILQTQTLQTIY